LGSSHAALAQSVGNTTRPVASGGAEPQADVDEILVTARSRGESLLSVPVSVTALKGEDIARYNATSLQSIATIVPQLFVSPGSSFGTGVSFNIRGLGTSLLDAGLDQSVLVDIDGVQIARGRVAAQSFFDIAQVEVLKGPQALFFGKNSAAGVISLKTAGPTKTVSGFVRAGYEFNANERYIEAAIGGPLSEAFGARLAVRASKMDGWLSNNAQPQISPFTGLLSQGAGNLRRLPRAKEYLGRLTLTYDDGGPFTATLKAFGSIRRANTDLVAEALCRGAFPSAFGVPDTTNDCKLNGKNSFAIDNPAFVTGYPKGNNGLSYADTDNVLTSLRLNYAAGNIDIQSTTGYYYYLSHFLNYPTGGLGFSNGEVRERFNQFSQELRAVSNFDGPLNFVIGGYYDHFTRPQYHNLQLVPLPGLPDPATGRYMAVQADRANHGTSYSGFGQLIYKIGEKFELAAGARYTHERRTTAQFNSYVNPVTQAAIPIFVAQGVVLREKAVNNNFSPEITASFHPSSDSTLYAAYKRGFKSGGLANPSVVSLDFAMPGALRFGPEKAKGFEVGAKGRFLDRRLTINSSAYRYNYSGLQLTTIQQSTAIFRINNAGGARVQGVEVEANYRVTDELTLRGDMAYNDAHFTSFLGAQCYPGQTLGQGCVNGAQDLTGDRLIKAPKWSGSAGLRYETPINDKFKLGLSGDAFYKGGYWLEDNRNPIAYQKGYVLLNAAVRLSEIEDRYEIAFIVQDITNKRYGLDAFDYPFGNVQEINVTEGRPRQFTLQASMKF
jgi:outer membrane receptor protein involved in Fe transport